MTVTKEEVAERLVDAAALMSTEPHLKPGMGMNIGQCVWTAIVDNDEDSDFVSDEVVKIGHAARDAVATALGVRSNSDIFEWNDRPERTKDECMELLVTTADKVRNGDLVLEGVS